MSVSALPSWLPASAGHVEEEVALATLRKLQRCQVHVPLLQRSVQTVYVETAAASSAAAPVAAAEAGKGSLGALPLLMCTSASACATRLLHLILILVSKHEKHLYTSAAMRCLWPLPQICIVPGSEVSPNVSAIVTAFA